MSQSQQPPDRDSIASQPVATEPDKGARVTRIDGAHPIRSREQSEPLKPSQEMAQLAAGDVSAHIEKHAGEQLRTQASQLARHLRTKQQQIDHRESQLNARIAQLEREVRASRLWCAEREHTFLERERELRQEIAEHQQKIQAFSISEVSADTELDRQLAAVREREAELDAREQRWRAGQMQVAREAEALRVAGQRLSADRAEHERQVASERQKLHRLESSFAEQQQRLLEGLAKHRDSLEERERRASVQRQELGILSQQEIVKSVNDQREALAAGSALLDEQTNALQSERVQFEIERKAVRDELVHERDLFEAHKRETEQSLAKLRDKLAARQAKLEQRRASLEQMKQQVFEAHRGTIEMRLVAEQLWNHAAKHKSAAELTQSLGALRGQLADEFRVSHVELSDKEQQLRELAAKLNERRQQFELQRTELNQWLERRNAGIEEQAARLVARELELDTQQQEIRAREAAWQQERRELRGRLRQLTIQLPPQAPAAA